MLLKQRDDTIRQQEEMVWVLSISYRGLALSSLQHRLFSATCYALCLVCQISELQSRADSCVTLQTRVDDLTLEAEQTEQREKRVRVHPVERKTLGDCRPSVS